MKSVLASIKPEYCFRIVSGKKTVEIRKNRPKIEPPFKCYIYKTKASYLVWQKGATKKYRTGCGKVIGEFVCDNIIEWADDDPPPVPLKATGLSYMDIRRYAPTDETIFCWHISSLKIYDKSKELSEFYRKCNSELCDVCGHRKYIRQNANEFDFDCDCDGYPPLSRPPQSWCYVAELD